MTRVVPAAVILASLSRAGAALASPATCDPAPVRAEAERWGRVFRVPASWLTTLAWVESRYCPGASNESGAAGVLQVKLSRAADLVRWLRRSAWGGRAEVLEVLGRWRGVREDLSDLTLNVMLAAFDLRRLRRKFGSNHDLVMAAYNQGEGAVGRAVRRGDPLPSRALEFVARVRRARESATLRRHQEGSNRCSTA